MNAREIIRKNWRPGFVSSHKPTQQLYDAVPTLLAENEKLRELLVRLAARDPEIADQINGILEETDTLPR